MSQLDSAVYLSQYGVSPAQKVGGRRLSNLPRPAFATLTHNHFSDAPYDGYDFAEGAERLKAVTLAGLQQDQKKRSFDMGKQQKGWKDIMGNRKLSRSLMQPLKMNN